MFHQFADVGCLPIYQSEIDELKNLADFSEKGRARICLHESKSDLIQEMIIAFNLRSRILPHRRGSGVKTYSILEGELDVFIFDNKAICQGVVNLSSRDGGTNYCRILRVHQSNYLMPIPRTDYVLLHEIATGPFIEGKDEYLDICNIDDTESFNEKLKALYGEYT